MGLSDYKWADFSQPDPVMIQRMNVWPVLEKALGRLNSGFIEGISSWGEGQGLWQLRAFHSVQCFAADPRTVAQLIWRVIVSLILY